MATVRLKALDGAWETCGVDRLRGIVPEDVELTANGWGSEACRFTLRRDPRAIYPDLRAFTQCEVEIGGVKVWSGRVWETPTSEGEETTINVEGQGWQFHLDDDVYSHMYVHTNLTDWVDGRSFPDSDLVTYWVQAPQVVSGDGHITISFPANVVAVNAKLVGVVLDCGSSIAKRIVVTYSGYNTSAGQSLGVRGTDSMSSLGDLLISTALGTGGAITSTTSAATLSTARRYLWFYLYQGAGGDITPTTDISLTLEAAQVFTDTAYESGNASILKADQVVKDARGKATILLSTSNSKIDAGTFSIPELTFHRGYKTPREVIDAANAYHAWRTKVDIDKRLVFEAMPSSPLFEIGEWSGVEFQDSSANSGEEIYSHVIAQATGPDGQPMNVTRSQAQQSGATLHAISSPAADNPSFATNTSSWTAGTSTITRDTVTYSSSPASGRWDNTGASDVLGTGDTLTETFTGTFEAGVQYVITWRTRRSSSSGQIIATFGTATDYATFDATISTAWTTETLSWTPSTTASSGVTLSFLWPGGASFVYVDSLVLSSATPTLVDRAGFKRTKILPIEAAMTNAGASQIGDVFLSLHKSTPFKGSLTVKGDNAMRRVTTGANVPPATLLLHTGELLRFADRVDPDTGGFGKDGRIASVTYSEASDTAQIAIDNERHRLDALLARLAVVNAQVR